VQRLSTLLDEVLEAYRIDTPGFRVNRTSINLQTVVTTALAPAREAYPDYTFDVQMGPAGAWLSGDRLRLEAVIRNLLDNAVKYSPAGSTIRIRLEHQLEGLHLIVSDEGLGIPAAELERVFEGFFRGSNLRSHDPGGMGLGLQLCRQIVACHDGRIWAESEEGRGTKIHIILPREEVELDGAGAAS
jgi:signal transduction histidine kinase